MDLTDLSDFELRSRLKRLGWELSIAPYDAQREIEIIYRERDLIEAELEKRAEKYGVWECYECGRQFPDHVDGEQPYGPKIITDEIGRQSVAGHICNYCVHPSLPSSLPEREQA